jgi:hypothetical protein
MPYYCASSSVLASPDFFELNYKTTRGLVGWRLSIHYDGNGRLPLLLTSKRKDKMCLDFNASLECIQTLSFLQ